MPTPAALTTLTSYLRAPHDPKPTDATIGDAARTSGVEALTVWDDDGSFKLYDRAARTWDTELLAALFGRA